MKFYDPDFVYKGKSSNFIEVDPSNQDLTDESNMYCGYLSQRTGSWVIQRIHSIGETFQHTYACGRNESTYSSCWDSETGRYIGDLEFKKINEVVPI